MSGQCRNDSELWKTPEGTHLDPRRPPAQAASRMTLPLPESSFDNCQMQDSRSFLR